MTRETFRLLAEASSEAYGKRSDFRDWCNEKGASNPDFVKKGGTKAYCFEIGDNRVLAFRGSVPHRLGDWQRDANLNKLKFDGGGCVHQGFSDALDEVWDELKQWLTTAGEKQLWVTGHSLGGALALLSAMRLDGEKVNVCTFGQPRIGDSKFASSGEKKLGDRYYRIVHNEDIVPRIPPYTLGFRHFGREVRIANGKAKELKSGVESTRDAIRQFVGEKVKIPKAVEGFLDPLLKASEMAVRPELVGPAITMIRTIQRPLSILGGGSVETFFEVFVKQVVLPRQSPIVLGPLHDHLPQYYIDAF
jgi:hypothetical protein